MTYEQVKNMMPANRRWCRWASSVYLQRFRGTIRIRYGYKYRCSRVIAAWYPDGRFKFKSWNYYQPIMSNLNYFVPDGYQVHSHRYHSFLQIPGQEPDDSRAFHVRHQSHVSNVNMVAWVWITKKGVKGINGRTLKEIRDTIKKEDMARDVPRRRGRYWLRKARGIYRKPCGKSYPGCDWRRQWPKPTTDTKFDCGCEVYTKKAVSRDTVRTIMEEINATVRTAKIQIYGIERFFNDAEAKTINKEAGYELLELNTGMAQIVKDRWGHEQRANLVLAALRMECSTTGKVYVNTVPSELRTVRTALDWMFDCTGYLDRIGVQT